MSYKITIKNGSEDTMGGSRVYAIYSEVPEVTGPGIANARQLQWAKTKPLANDGQDVFKYTSDTYGFAGYVNASTSSNVAPGTEVTLDSSALVTVGSFRNDGSVLSVKETDGAIGISDTGTSSADNGKFTISVDARVPTPSTYVIGVARKSDRDGIAPVAIVEAKPRGDFVFTPSQAIIITRGDKGNGVAVSKPAVVAKIEFRGASKEAVVTETNSGSFSVVYK
jgi:hypothetical protein